MSRSVLLGVFLLGGLGAVARIWIGGAVQRAWGTSFPIGTVVVNILGCLLFGIVWALAEQRQLLSHETRFLILSGFMGAFTTFSTFAFESHFLILEGRTAIAMANLVGQCGLGLLAIQLGIRLGRVF